MGDSGRVDMNWEVRRTDERVDEGEEGGDTFLFDGVAGRRVNKWSLPCG
jgi:hypothetical protein